ncbi:MAG TPA: C-type polyheme cytochrome OmcB, partial [Geobacter anodireducens]|nr:C-type polyheme cytochrome OmcB [Geobacter anodireducens]
YAGVNNAGTGTTGTSVTVSYPDIAGSNVCMTCHLGRQIGENIKTITDADGVLGFVNSHYLAAGGQLFGKTGYEYATRSYANPAFFAHDKIGTAAAPGTGSNGPCAGCHMSTPNSHSFLPVTKDSAGAVTAITSTACATCHSGTFALTPEGLTAEEEEYVASLEALKAALAGKGILFFNAHPYFYIDTNSNGIADPGEIVSSNAFTNWAGVYGLALWKDVMGAAFNANLLIHDPGGYAHNRFYSKRLIWDSIDFIYDGVLNNDVAAAIDAQVTATRLDSATATAAKAYLGTTRP